MTRNRASAVGAPAGVGLSSGSAPDAFGCLYLIDECHHRVVIDCPRGELSAFGRFGCGAGEFRFPSGLAVIAGKTPTATRIFVADTWNHRVQVFDGRGELQMAFGGFGHADGQLHAPSDVAVVTPQLPWETDGTSVPMLAVADEWNQRLQVFTTDGTWLATLGGHGVEAEPGTHGQGWPFFRVGAVAVPRRPVRLSWQAPWLTVIDGNGRASHLELAAAMLPRFEEWLDACSPAERAHARRYFRRRAEALRALPAAVRAALNSPA